MAQLAELELYQFFADAAGREVLDILYEAMITANVSVLKDIRRRESNSFGLPGASHAEIRLRVTRCWHMRVRRNWSSSGLCRSLQPETDKASVTFAQGLRGHRRAPQSVRVFLRKVRRASFRRRGQRGGGLPCVDGQRAAGSVCGAGREPSRSTSSTSREYGRRLAVPGYEAERIIQVKNAQTPLSEYQSIRSAGRSLPESISEISP